MAKKMGIAYNGTLMFNYPGGPGASANAGSTVIRCYVDTTLNALPNVMNYTQIANAYSINNAPVTNQNIKDFRKSTQDYKNSPSNWDFENDSRQARLGLSNPAAMPTKEKIKGGYRVAVSPDMMNKLVPYIRKKDGADPYKENETILARLGVKVKDIIKFGFECMSNDTPGDSIMLLFRAFLTNGFTDNNTAVLNSFRYAGRGEEFHTYQGFTRSISFSFKIVAFSRADMKGNYSKLNQLISQVYPDYSPNTNVMRAPVVKVTIGDYLYRVPGFLESVNVTVDNAHPWEIKLSEKEDDVQQLPMILDVSISFKPIHNILPRRQTIDRVELISHDKYLWAPEIAIVKPTPQNPPTPSSQTESLPTEQEYIKTDGTKSKTENLPTERY
jgi:hypothetical protein